ncbi:MAG: hypothetical protein IJR08_03900 [Bacilli bacterium]|nr:hypothetical protein [Bacilli bacterium]
MNLIKVKEQLLSMARQIRLQVEEETKEKLTLHAYLTANNYFKNSIYFRIVVFASGTLHVFFTFDEVERTYDNLYIINTFNAENPWFRAYIGNINGSDFLELHYTSLSMEKENEVTDTVGYLLNEILEEDNVKYINSILNNNEKLQSY